MYAKSRRGSPGCTQSCLDSLAPLTVFLYILQDSINIHAMEFSFSTMSFIENDYTADVLKIHPHYTASVKECLGFWPFMFVIQSIVDSLEQIVSDAPRAMRNTHREYGMFLELAAGESIPSKTPCDLMIHVSRNVLADPKELRSMPSVGWRCG